MAVMKPFHAKLILTEKRIKLSIFLICVLSVSLHVHMVFEWERISLLICGVSSEGYLSTELFDDKYHVVHHVIVDGLFRCAIPLTLLIILNSRMAMVIYKAQKQRSVITTHGSTSAQRQSKTMTAMVVGVVTIFTICQVPNWIYVVEYGIKMAYPHSSLFTYDTRAKWYVLRRFLLLINSSVNCLIYVAVGKTFRQKLFSSCRRRSIELA